MAILLMLHPKRDSMFRRVIPGVRVLEFQPNTPIKITNEESIDAVANDVGASLVICKVEKDEAKNEIVSVDWEATIEAAASIGLAKTEANEKSIAEHDFAVQKNLGLKEKGKPQEPLPKIERQYIFPHQAEAMKQLADGDIEQGRGGGGILEPISENDDSLSIESVVLPKDDKDFGIFEVAKKTLVNQVGRRLVRTLVEDVVEDRLKDLPGINVEMAKVVAAVIRKRFASRIKDLERHREQLAEAVEASPEDKPDEKPDESNQASSPPKKRGRPPKEAKTE